MESDPEESAVASAANLARLGSEDEYEEESFPDQVLQDHTIPLDTSPPRLQVFTRNSRALAGGQSFPPCRSQSCRGCKPSCREEYEGREENFWCQMCAQARDHLCETRDRCIFWSEEEHRQFKDLQVVARSGALESTMAEPNTFPPATLRRPGTTLGGEAGSRNDTVPIVQETTEAACTQTPPPPPQGVVSADQRATSLSLIESVRPKILRGTPTRPEASTSTPASEALSREEEMPTPRGFTSQKGIPTGGGKIQSFPSYKSYGAGAVSPSPAQPGNTEQMFNSAHLFEHPLTQGRRQEEAAEQPWDGGGLPGPRSQSGDQQQAIWNQMRNLSVNESRDEDDFASPMSQTPNSVITGDDGYAQRPLSVRPILKAPVLMPGASRHWQEDHRYQTPTVARTPTPNSAFTGWEEDQNQRKAFAGELERRQENSARVTWSTPVRRSNLEKGRRRVSETHLREQEEREPSQLHPPPDRGDDAQAEDNQTRVTRVLEMLTSQLMRTQNNRQSGTSSIKLPQLTLPSIKRSASGEVGARAYFSWKANLAHSIHNHGIDPNAILLLYSTNEKLLPIEWQTILCSSSSLQSAIFSLDMLFPPLSSLHPEIVKEMTSLATLTSPSEKTKVFRISTLLKSLEELLKLFGNDAARDLSRQEVMVVLYSLSSSSESRAELVTEVCAMDRDRKRGVLYAQSLRNYLVRTRMVLTDIIAAIRLVGRPEAEHVGKHKSAAAHLRMEEKGRKREISCMLCTKLHPTFSCKEQLALVREGKRTLPKQLCNICLQKTGEKHPKDCGLRRIQKDGIFRIIDFKCARNCGVNNRLCACRAGPSISIDKDQSPAAKIIGSAATRVVEINLMEDEVGVEEEVAGDEELEVVHTAAARPRLLEEERGEVIFQAENIYLQGRDQQTLRAVASYDTHGSSHFLAGELPENFNWAKANLDKSFEIDTIHGKTFTRHQVFKVKILTLQGALQMEVIKGSWIQPHEEARLGPDLAERFGVTVPDFEDEKGDALPRIIIGCSLISKLHPRHVKVPAGLSEIQPGLACFRSRVSKSNLCAGALSTTLGGSQ